MRNMVLTTALCLALAMGINVATQDATGAASKMKDLKGFEELKSQFNADKGKARLLLLLSPT